MLRSSPCVDVSVLGKGYKSPERALQWRVPSQHSASAASVFSSSTAQAPPVEWNGSVLGKDPLSSGLSWWQRERWTPSASCRPCLPSVRHEQLRAQYFKRFTELVSPSVAHQCVVRSAPPSCTRMKQNCATVKWAPIAIKVPTLSWGEIRGNSAIFRKIRRNCGVYIWVSYNT